jgi:hypothetical protein
MEIQDVIIHVRFAPNGTVVEIGERPKAMSPQEWYFYLSDKAANAYQPFAGGRGVFRLTKGEVDSLKADSRPAAA